LSLEKKREEKGKKRNQPSQPAQTPLPSLFPRGLSLPLFLPGPKLPPRPSSFPLPAWAAPRPSSPSAQAPFPSLPSADRLGPLVGAVPPARSAPFTLSLTARSHASAPSPSFLLPRAPLGPEIPGDLLSPSPHAKIARRPTKREPPRPWNPNPSRRTTGDPQRRRPFFLCRASFLASPWSGRSGAPPPPPASAPAPPERHAPPQARLPQEPAVHHRNSSKAPSRVRSSAASIAHRRRAMVSFNPLSIFTGATRANPRDPEALITPVAIGPRQLDHLRRRSSSSFPLRRISGLHNPLVSFSSLSWSLSIGCRSPWQPVAPRTRARR
jgi:hypothetical protein